MLDLKNMVGVARLQPSLNLKSCFIILDVLVCDEAVSCNRHTHMYLNPDINFLGLIFSVYHFGYTDP